MDVCSEEISDYLSRLFPLCRSITGSGLRESLAILAEIVPLRIDEIPTGTRAFDWIVPNEWSIKDAFVKSEAGIRIIDFRSTNLHLVGYSEPFDAILSLDELREHLHSIPENPDAIPYLTSYYEQRWGFCVKDTMLKRIENGEFGQRFHVKVDSTLSPGSLSLGELIIPGEDEGEILFWSYLCHPSMANHELSGPLVAAFLARNLLRRNGKHRYTYRFVFGPETIGSVAYIAPRLSDLQENVVAGYVVTCAGLDQEFTYIKTRAESTLADRACIHALKNSGKQFQILNFLSRGSDERQFNAPGVDLPVGSLMRARYGTFPEYHTSKDNLEFVEIQGIQSSFEMYLACIETLEQNRIYRTMTLCEPQLSRRGLRGTLSGVSSITSNQEKISHLLAYADGKVDLITIADYIGCSTIELSKIAEDLVGKELMTRL
jgi:aminopeptidase-like protein